MGDWFRSATVLVMAFVAALVVTIGLANVIVPGGAPDSEAAQGGGGSTPAATVLQVEGVGGHLSVSGDREGTLTLTRESNDQRYSLIGDGTRMVFVTDFLWRSPLGLRINAQDTAGVTQTEDWVRLRGRAPHGGRTRGRSGW